MGTDRMVYSPTGSAEPLERQFSACRYQASAGR